MVLLRGLPSYKSLKGLYVSAMCNGKSKKKPHKPKSEDTNQEKLYLLHMDLCGPMRVTSVNGKKYILVIVDDYSRFIRVKYLRSKDEAPDFIIKFLKMIQVRLKVPVRRIRIDNGTEFVNQTLRKYYEKVGISHETSGVRSLQQNSVVERSNHTLIEAARTMLIYAKALLFVWAEAVATACYTQNHSIICIRHGKTPYELLHDKLLDLSFFHVFGALCYPTNDSENLGKLQPKADIDFDEMTAMASKHSSSGPVLHEMTHVIISSGLCPKPPLNIVAMYHLQELIGILCFNHSRTRFAFILVLSIPQQLLAKMHQHLVTHKQHTETQSPVIPNVLKEDIQTLDVCIHDNDPFFEHSYQMYTGSSFRENFIGELRMTFSQDFNSMNQALISFTMMPFSHQLNKDLLSALIQACWIEAILQILQSPRGIFINQFKYALESLRKYGIESSDPMDTPMVEKFKLDEDTQRKVVDPTHYRGMIGTLMLASRPDLTFDYPKDSSIALTAYAYADYAGCQDTRRKQVENGVVELYFVNIEYQLTDIFTKALGRERIEFLINKLGMRIFTPKTLKQLADEVKE
ncbi:retrovirus-related pol polyprotein from transposon TNT 1-94 [Tanacetum coccineum]